MKDGKKVILIVEDEPDLLEMYTIALLNKGYEVLSADNGVEAMGWIEEGHSNIDVILLDIIMPKMDGFETLKKIKADERFKNIKVAFLTNLDGEGDKKQAFEMGVDFYFIKAQHTPAELVEKIDMMFV